MAKAPGLETNLIFLATLVVALILVRWLAWLSLKSTNHLIAKASSVATTGRPGELFRSTRANLGKMFPRTMALIEARLTPRKFTGLALTLMVLAAVYIAALLGGLIDELREAEELVRMDEGINDALAVFRTDEIVHVFAFITEWANASAVVAVAAVTTGLLLALRHGHLVMPLWVVVLGSQMTTYAGKYGFGRERPEFLTEIIAVTPSFPSGHATSAIAVYGFIAYVLSREAVTVRRRFEIVFWSAVLIVLIGFSRMLLSLHYTSDVVAGFLVGGFWLLVGFALAELIRSRRSAPGHPDGSNSRNQGP
ncbi:phosphatase PAP2 family protein [Wenzhouxiangella sp. XN201]|uniref:phosphatase PAP2 family protein n=1 Tax=Wenzhouxiangella sp. XN201 TaxID=2710755 RepID=UPI0013C6880E|nr:phosphatase PAP2 family protein [Wenzhouxiangella sp. XN201]NEZ04704.1 phosphatase PAP2 family protein [Wenzhouxiangella sp. XN201]